MGKVTCKTCSRKLKMSKKDDCECDNNCCPIKYDITGIALDFNGQMIPDNIDIVQDFKCPAPKITPMSADSALAYEQWLQGGGKDNPLF